MLNKYSRDTVNLFSTSMEDEISYFHYGPDVFVHAFSRDVWERHTLPHIHVYGFSKAKDPEAEYSEVRHPLHSLTLKKLIVLTQHSCTCMSTPCDEPCLPIHRTTNLFLHAWSGTLFLMDHVTCNVHTENSWCSGGNASPNSHPSSSTCGSRKIHALRLLSSSC